MVYLFFKSSSPSCFACQQRLVDPLYIVHSKPVCICSVSHSAIIYSYVEHVNRVRFKFVPDPFLAGALSFTVSSTYITSEMDARLTGKISVP